MRVAIITVVPWIHTCLDGALTTGPIILHAAISKIFVTINVSPEYVVLTEEGVIRLEEAATNIAGLLLQIVTATPELAILTLLATEHSRVTNTISAGYERCCGLVLDRGDHTSGLLICPANILVHPSVLMLLVTAVVMLQGSGVAGGASFMGIMAEQVVITLICCVGADPNIYTTTSLL